MAAVAGGLAVIASLWTPWFSRQVSSVFSAVEAQRMISGWRAVGGVGGVVALLGGVAVVWGVGRAREERPSGFWLVMAGAVLSMIEVAVTVAEVGVKEVTTTTPVAGLALAFAGSVTLVLVGMAVLVAEARARSRAG